MLRMLLAPFWLVRILTREKSYEHNPILSSRRLNERGLHTARVIAAARLAAMRRRRIARRLSSEDREALDRDGFIIKRDFLPETVFAELVAQIKQLRAPARELVEGDTITRRIALDPGVLAQVPALRQLFRTPNYWNLIRYAWSFSAAPMVYIQTILSRAVDGPPDPQSIIHSDTFHPTVKAWLYLNDMAAEAMPFVYVPGSHRLTRERIEWERRMSLWAANSTNAEDRQGSFRIDAHDLKALGLPKPRHLNVPKNTLIVADTFGFHARGRSARPTMRVEIWAFGRRNPFLPWIGLDPWSIGRLALRKPLIDWQLFDVLEAWGLARQRWRPRGEMSPFGPPRVQPQTCDTSVKAHEALST
jgi:hypothetical protein